MITENFKAAGIGITGADGFVAAYLKKKLDAERLPYEEIDLKTYQEQGFSDFVKGKDYIFHLAGVNRTDDEKGYEKGNVGLTVELIDAVKKHGKKGCRIIFSSSIQVYGDAEGIIDETIPTRPLWAYSKTKLDAENAIIDSGLPYVVLRISNVYGPGGRPFYNSVIATFIHLLKEGKPITINGSGQQTRDYIFVDDVASAMVLSMDISDGIYIVSTGKLTSLNEIVRVLQDLSGKKIEVDRTYAEDAAENIAKAVFDNSKLVSAGWQPSYNILEGLKRCL